MEAILYCLDCIVRVGWNKPSHIVNEDIGAFFVCASAVANNVKDVPLHPLHYVEGNINA